MHSRSSLSNMQETVLQNPCALPPSGRNAASDAAKATAARGDARFSYMLRELRSRICDDPKYVGPRQLGTIAHALAKLGAGKTSPGVREDSVALERRALDTLARTAAQRAQEFDAAELSTVVAAAERAVRSWASRC